MVAPAGFKLHRNNNAQGSGINIPATANVHPTATIDPDAHIGEYVIIEKHSVVRKGATIEPYAHIGSDVTIHTNANVGKSATIGNRTEVRPTACIPDYWAITRYSYVNPGADGVPVILPRDWSGM